MRTVAMALILMSLSHLAWADNSVRFDVPVQPLADAVRAVAAQSNMNIFMDADIQKRVGEQRSVALSGELTLDEALTRLLQGTGLTYEFINGNTVTVTQKSAAAVAGNAGLRLARAADTADTEQKPVKESAESSGGIQEIVVTAQKRTERLQDVPVPVTVVNADSLVNSNQLRLQDYYTKIPGLSLTLLEDTAAPSLTIRGVTTDGYTNPTVGIVVDDIAFGTSTTVGGGTHAPDLDPSDLASIEVLRGPQGTLYGSSSIGGLMKYVTLDPSTQSVSGRIQGGTSFVRNGDGMGYNVRGSVNAPLGETFAVLLSGYHRQEPGYIDNTQTGEEGVNSRHASGARLSALWRPNDKFSLKLSALYQDNERNGEDTIHLPSPAGVQTTLVSGQPDLGEFQQYALLNTGSFQSILKAYSAIAKLDTGRGELTSLTGYSVNRFASSLDATPSLAGLTLAQFGVRSTASIVTRTTNKFSQELRYSTPLGDAVDWLAGAFYTNEDYPEKQDVVPVNQATGAIIGSFWDVRRAATYTEKAAFTDLTFKLTDRFDVQVGARASRDQLIAGEEISAGPYSLLLGRTFSFVAPETSSSGDSLTYLLTPRFKLSPDMMLYARFASGYRPGGPNPAIPSSNLALPKAYDADTTQNYEVGFKGYLFDRVLSVDASLYYIDWKDLQIQLRDATTRFLYNVNAGRAKSQGFELSFELKPADGLTIAVSGALGDAKLTEDFPAAANAAGAFGFSGDRLPYSPKFSGYASIDQRFPVGADITGFAGASLSYVGERQGRFFAQSVEREVFGSYSQVDLRGGVKFSTWELSAFLNNLTDTRGLLRGGRDSSLNLLYARNYTQPRTAGLSLSKAF